MDIIDGRLDVNESRFVSAMDDLTNSSLLVELPFGIGRRMVDVIDGMIDTDQDGSITSEDDLSDVRLLVP